MTGTGSGSSKNDRGCGIEKFGAMVLADTEYIEPDPVSDFDLFEKTGHAIGG